MALSKVDDLVAAIVIAMMLLGALNFYLKVINTAKTDPSKAVDMVTENIENATKDFADELEKDIRRKTSFWVWLSKQSPWVIIVVLFVIAYLRSRV